jgi:YesN/AraC family two-component response regulator
MAREAATVLVVDDEKTIVQLLKEVLTPHYRVVTAENGEEALQLLKSRPVDVIITDQRMPRMSGTKLLEQSLAINPRIVKIILSAYTDTSDILSAINVCRVNHFLTKPIDIDQILDVVKKALALVPESARYD